MLLAESMAFYAGRHLPREQKRTYFAVCYSLVLTFPRTVFLARRVGANFSIELLVTFAKVERRSRPPRDNRKRVTGRRSKIDAGL